MAVGKIERGLRSDACCCRAGQAPIHKAAFTASVDFSSLMNAVEREKHASLRVADNNAKLFIIELLISKGAHVNAKDK